MRYSDTLLMCLRNLAKRKLRSLLTMLGVVVGTAALVLTISLGLATEAQFDALLDDMGLDMTIINVWPRFGGGGMIFVSGGMNTMEQEFALDRYAIEAMSNLPGVVVASPQMRSWLSFRSGPYQMQGNVVGMDPEALAMMGHPLAAGRQLQAGDEGVAIFGGRAEWNFDRANTSWEQMRRMQFWMTGEAPETAVDVMNDHIIFSYDNRLIWGGMTGAEDIAEVFRPIPTMTLEVVGLFEDMGDWNVDENIFMDIDTLLRLELLRQEADRENQQEWGVFSARRGGISPNFDQAIVRTANIQQTRQVAEAIEEMGFWANYAGAWIDNMRAQQRNMQNLLVAIAAVSIFVAAISIANTMIMSVYERTREIGVMKVIGGAIADIRRLFLLEAALIGFFGGILGVALSLGGSYLLNNIDNTIFSDPTGWLPETEHAISIVTPWLCGVAIGFATLIGLVSGYYPAHRATRLSALAAIRTD